MPLVSVPAIYDGQHVKLLERAPVESPYRVVVTFLGPADEDRLATPDRTRFWSSLGAWQDDRPIEATLQDIRQARHSKQEPPKL